MSLADRCDEIVRLIDDALRDLPQPAGAARDIADVGGASETEDVTGEPRWRQPRREHAPSHLAAPNVAA